MLINSYRYAVTFDADAQTYITAVETADGQALESGVKDAINAFVVGCKADGIWTAIKACCILAGARTLDGALTPLVGTAPTNFNFVAADYDRKTGLMGNGSNKYLDTNRAGNADPQNSKHLSVYISDFDNVNSSRHYTANVVSPSNGGAQISSSTLTTTIGLRLHSTSGYVRTSTLSNGFFGINRSLSSQFLLRAGNADIPISNTSTTPNPANQFVFSASAGAGPVNARLPFYSIGESLDLALLDARVTDLINAFASAIP